jgi:hypothetical protein
MNRIRVGALSLLASVLLTACGQAASIDAANPSSASPPVATKLDVSGLHRVYATPRLSGGRPLTVFVGGQFCPFCAAMRWPFVKALGRFGTFSGLGQMQSRAGTDGFASIYTYDFARASYKSDLLTVHLVEAADANGNPLQQPGPEDKDLLNRFDPNGSIPFVFIAGTYVAQLPYSPGLLAGKTFEQIQDQASASNPGDVGAVINSEADAITAAICKIDGGQPGSVCQGTGIQALVDRMP